MSFAAIGARISGFFRGIESLSYPQRSEPHSPTDQSVDPIMAKHIPQILAKLTLLTSNSLPTSFSLDVSRVGGVVTYTGETSVGYYDDEASISGPEYATRGKKVKIVVTEGVEPRITFEHKDYDDSLSKPPSTVVFADLRDTPTNTLLKLQTFLNDHLARVYENHDRLSSCGSQIASTVLEISTRTPIVIELSHGGDNIAYRFDKSANGFEFEAINNGSIVKWSFSDKGTPQKVTVDGAVHQLDFRSPVEIVLSKEILDNYCQTIDRLKLMESLNSVLEFVKTGALSLPQ